MKSTKGLQILALAAFIAGSSTAASAEGVKDRLGISGLAQAGIPLGEKWVRDNGDTGLLYGGMIRYGVAKHVEIAAGYDNADLDTGYRVEPLLLSGIYSFTPDKKWTPTASVGVGAATAGHNATFDNLTTRLGLGMEYFVTKNFAIGPQVNYTYANDNGGAAREHHILGAGVLATLFFHNITAPAAAAAAPVVAKPAPTPVAAVPAAPAVDSDKDGVMDNADQCPGTPNGIAVDPNGCPKKIEERVSIDLKVLFDTGKNVVKSEYMSEIERVANFLKAYPTTNAEIEGHTDSTGNHDYNVGLSQRRADAIREVFVKDFGIATTRLSAKGYGPDQPIADNKTVDGRSKNRRVVATVTAMKKVQ